MTIDAIIRAAIPDITDDGADYILWGRTAFPLVKLTARDLYRTARRVDRAHRNGIQLCDCCDRKVERGRSLCERCGETLDKYVANPPT